MRWLRLYIAVLMVCLISAAHSQVLTPMGSGLTHVPLASVEWQGTYTVVASNSEGNYFLSSWDGENWQESAVSGLNIKHENTGGKVTKVLSVASQNDILFVLVSQKISAAEPEKYYILKYASEQWTEITDQTISAAVELKEILIYSGTPVVIGRNNKNTPANIFYYENAEWVAKGNYLTPDVSKDIVIDAEIYGNKIFLSGVFTKIGSSDKRYMAEWNGEQWNFVNFPPFAQQVFQFGMFGNQLVLHGKPATGNEAIRVYNGSNWQNLSSGLNEIKIIAIENFAWHRQMLWACGSFSNADDTRSSKLMYYHPDRGWLLANSGLNSYNIFLGQYKDLAILNGNFEQIFDQDFQHVAEISAFNAQLSGNIFNDVNGNCLFDQGESYLSGVTFVLKPGDFYFSTDAKGSFSIPVMPGNYSITPIVGKNYEFKCSPYLINVDAYQVYSDARIGLRSIADRTDAAVNLYDYSGWKVTADAPNHYRLCARNVGTVTLESSKLIFYLPQELEQFVFNPMPDFLDLTRAEWSLAKILVNGEYCVDITAMLKSGADKSKPVKLNSKIEVSGNQDLDPGDNQELLQQDWASAIQYNSKSSALKGHYQSDADPLHYRISFQNQTKVNASRIRITDTLDEDISIGAQGIIENSSHPSVLTYRYRLLPDGRYQYILNWDFKDIQIPDSAVDFQKSLGFVDLKIYTDMRYMKQGADICNRAQLYFNNNEPMSTNSVCNQIGTPGSVNTVTERLKVYPNPAGSFLDIAFNNKIGEYQLFNLLGERVLNGKLSDGVNRLDLSSVVPGVYFLKVDGYTTERIVVKP